MTGLLVVGVVDLPVGAIKQAVSALMQAESGSGRVLRRRARYQQWWAAPGDFVKPFKTANGGS